MDVVSRSDVERPADDRVDSREATISRDSPADNPQLLHVGVSRLERDCGEPIGSLAHENSFPSSASRTALWRASRRIAERSTVGLEVFARYSLRSRSTARRSSVEALNDRVFMVTSFSGFEVSEDVRRDNSGPTGGLAVFCSIGG